jgi:hypothetical protein
MVIDLYAATARHEAAHAAACIRLGRPIEYVRIDRPHYDLLGEVRAPLVDEIRPREIVIVLVGHIADGRPDWPPPWPVRRDEAESLGVLVEYLGVSEEKYARLITSAEAMVSDPEFQKLARLIERALLRVPVIGGEDIYALCQASQRTKEHQ